MIIQNLKITYSGHAAINRYCKIFFKNHVLNYHFKCQEMAEKLIFDISLLV